jgi:serine protease Do
VIINRQGHILTAGHVSGKPGQEVTIILQDGRKVRGKTLGCNQDIDSGLIKITEPGRWPYLTMGDSAKLKKGQWCLAVGHPGGYKVGRSAVVRVGRVLENHKGFVQTDCALVGGDSGGPLFDLQGKVIGIHSRIGKFMTSNLHVPVNTYRQTWNRLMKSEVWGGRSVEGERAYLGVRGNSDLPDCKIVEIVADSPAGRAGLREGDVITKLDDEPIDDFDDLKSQIKNRKPGDQVVLEVLRGRKSITVKIVLGKQED